jgi:DNA-binding XRE family transcriptional regulator
MPKGELRTRYRNRIAVYREAMQMTQEELAAELGVARNTLARWEVDRHVPSPAMISRLAWVLACRARDLYLRAVVVGVGAVTLYLLGGKDVANGLIMMGTALAAALGARITREK